MNKDAQLVQAAITDALAKRAAQQRDVFNQLVKQAPEDADAFWWFRTGCDWQARPRQARPPKRWVSLSNPTEAAVQWSSGTEGCHQ